MSDYEAFLAGKDRSFHGSGIEAAPEAIHPALFPFQRDLTRWALRKGRSAIFATTGLGKTRMQLEWARHIPGPVLVLAPLVVAQQTITEAAAIDLQATYARSQPADPGQVTVTNYEMLAHFDASRFAGVVLDESSILKAHDGETRNALIEAFAATPYRLCCTATPAPNDTQEFANHAEFLGILSRVEMLATFFVHDDEGWRLKRPAREPFYKWLASWGMSVGKPSDLGYSDDGYDLPPLSIQCATVPTDYVPDGQLFATDLKGVSHRAQVRKGTVRARVEETVKIIYGNWNLNGAESEWPGPKSSIETTTGPTVNESSNATEHGLPIGRPKSATAGLGTTANGTPRTERPSGQSSKSNERPEPQRSLNGAASNGANTTSQTVSESSLRCESTTSATRAPSDLADSGEPTESISETTKTDSSYKTDGVPSATSRQKTPSAGSTSTTTTLPEQSEDFSAPTATEGSASSETTCSDSTPPSLISPNHTKKPLEKWIVWCGRNDEQESLERLLGPLCVSVYGSLPLAEKISRERQWRLGDVPVMLTKVSIFGFGINWQHCSHQVFVGLSDSYEQYFQAIRRSWRFGQSQPVDVYIVLSDLETPIYDNVLRKEREAAESQAALIRHAVAYERAEIAGLGRRDPYTANRLMQIPAWLTNGERTRSA